MSRFVQEVGGSNSNDVKICSRGWGAQIPMMSRFVQEVGGAQIPMMSRFVQEVGGLKFQ